MKSTLAFVFALFLFGGVAHANEKVARNPVYLNLVQGEEVFSLVDGQEVTLERASFSLLFPCHTLDLSCPAGFIAHTSDSFFSHLVEGERITENNPFFSARSMALLSTPSTQLILADDRWHHIVFNKEQEIFRANLERQLEGELVELRWDVEELVDLGAGAQTLEKTEMEKLFVAYFADINADKVMDKGELIRFVIVFK